MADDSPLRPGHDSELLDSVYDLTPYEEEYITSSFPQSVHKYSLFSTGIKLFRAFDHTGFAQQNTGLNSKLINVVLPYDEEMYLSKVASADSSASTAFFSSALSSKFSGRNL